MKRLLDPDSLRALARGCAVLGAGGGGDPYLGLLQALQATEDFGPVPLVDLDELPGDSLVMPCGGIGAPTVSVEKIENGDEGARLREHLEFLTGRQVAALMAAEIGGSNGLLPICWAARMRLPVVDADGMGRAFPEVPQVTMHLAGISPSPAVMTDERGNLVLFQTISGHWMERLERAAAVEFGGAASSTEFSMTVAQARDATVRDSVSLAIRIGETIVAAEDSPVDALIAALSAFRLITGKVLDVERRTTSGFARGSVVVEGLGADAGRLVRLELQNENLVRTPPISTPCADSRGNPLVSTPRSVEVPPTSATRESEIPVRNAAPRTRLAGPRAFGYEFDYLPVEELAGATA